MPSMHAHVLVLSSKLQELVVPPDILLMKKLLT